MSDMDKYGYTAMVAAAHGGSVEAMKCVLANGGNMSGVLRWCRFGGTAKYCLICGGN